MSNVLFEIKSDSFISNNFFFNLKIAAQQRYANFQRLLWDQMRQIDQSRIFDPNLYRQVRLMSIIGTNALPPDQLDRYNRIVNDMLAIFNSADICAFEQPFKCGLKLQPHLKTVSDFLSEIYGEKMIENFL